MGREVICRKYAERQAGAQADSKARSVRCVSEEARKGETEEFPILHVRVHQKMPPYKVVVEADGQGLELEVDTGSSGSLISQTTFKQLWPDKQLSQCQYCLRSYANTPIKVVGCFDSQVCYKSQVAKLPIIVVEGSGPDLLGRNWLKYLVLDWHEIHHIYADPLQAAKQAPHGVSRRIGEVEQLRSQDLG